MSALEIQPVILIVEDDPTVLKAMVSGLEPLYDVRIATTAEQGLALLEQKPHLVLTDLNLPGWTPDQWLTELSQALESTDTPLLIVTSDINTDSEVKCLKMGAQDFIKKPISLPVLQMRCRVHLDLQRKTQMLRELATIDPLTGVANRRLLDLELDRYWSLMGRQRKALSVVMIDLDYFKHVNDELGHAVGDTCLKRCATIIKEALFRPSDVIGRYGGEEFVVLLPGTDRQGAEQVAERIVDRIAQESRGFYPQQPERYITASVGVALEYPSTLSAPHQLIAKADAAMYRAKENGKNQYVVA